MCYSFFITPFNPSLFLFFPSLSSAHVRRLDSRWRCGEIRRLRHDQDRLKAEMAAAKGRIGADPKRWSFELHVEGSWPDERARRADPAFVEAFDQETAILRKRVDACKSHVKMVTAFDVRPGDDAGTGSTGCTTECEFAQCILIDREAEAEAEAGATTETDII